MKLKLSKKEILSGNLYKGLIIITVPLIFLNLINTFYSVVDTYFVGRLGELQVGAITAIRPVVACGTAFTEGLCAAGIALISRSIGKGEDKKAESIAKHLIILCLILGTLIGLVTSIFGKDILAWLDAPTELINDAYRYLLGISFDFIFLFTISMYQAIRQAHGDSKSGVILNTCAALLNCLLDPLFIFTFKLGTLGAALATALSKAIVTPIAIHNLLNGDGHKYFKEAKIELPLFSQIIKVAVPSSVGHFLGAFGFVLLSKEIANYGAGAMSGYGVGSSISEIYYIFVNCWGAGLATFVGTSLGANDKSRARNAYKSSMLIVGIVAAVFIPLGLLTSKSVIHLLIKNVSDEVLSIGLNYAYFAIFTSFCMGWLNNLVGVFNGSTNTLISMILNGSRIWFIRIPIIKLLNRVTTLGVTNIWVAMCISNLIVCLIGTLFYLYYPWDKKQLKI